METWPSLVYGTGLENRRTFARPVGPNPTVSSTFLSTISSNGGIGRRCGLKIR